MGQEKILLVGDSLEGPTGFANDLAGIAWSLAEKYEVHTLGLQSFQDSKVKINIEDSTRDVYQHANLPRTNKKWDFGERSLPRLLDALEPEILITVNDIQMIQHIPYTMCPPNINLQVIDLPAKKFISEEALRMELEGALQKYREKYPRDTKWIAYSPHDGDPPMMEWGNIYRMADQVVAMSEYGRKIFKDYFNIDAPRIWHGVDTAKFKPMKKPPELEDKFVIGNINRNQPRKQPVRGIMAFAKFAKDKKDVLLHYQMDWNDPFGWPIQYFANLYGVLNKMISPRPVGMSREEVAMTYNMWDLNLMHSGGEGFGLPFIEAGACGVPTLGSDYTTSRELLIEGKPSPRGSLVKVKDLHWEKLDVAAVRRALVDIDDLAKIMNKYYYNRDLLEEHGRNAAEWCKKNHSWTVIGEQWKKLVDDVLSR